MKKAARITGIVLGCVFLIICALPIVGAAVNIADGHIRADRAEKLISDMGGEICGSCVYTGNTSGTGNHTDVYPSSEAWQRFYMFDPFEEMDIPREEGYYIVDIICPAPFGDNIMGH